MRVAVAVAAACQQPIVHKFDHSYVASVLKAHPGKFKGVCLANPTLGPDAAANELTKLKKQGHTMEGTLIYTGDAHARERATRPPPQKKFLAVGWAKCVLVHQQLCACVCVCVFFF